MKKLEKGLVKVMKGLLSMSLRYDIHVDSLLGIQNIETENN